MATLTENIARNNQFHSDLRDLIIENGGTIPSDTPCEDLLPIIENMFGGSSSADTEFLKAMIERPTNAEIVIPQGVTKIARSAFYDFRTLRTVSIPDSVAYLGVSAFQMCSELVEISIPNQVDYIPSNCFQSSGIRVLHLPSGLIHIAANAFFSCSNLLELIIPSGCVTVGGSAFQQCGSLKWMHLPNSLKALGGTYTFYLCRLLEYVTLEQGFNAKGLNLSASTLYSAETIVSWLNALADRTGEETYTLTIGSDNLAKLTAEQIAIATNKNWNLV